MNNSNVMGIATSMIAFSGFLVGLFATIYYTNQIRELKTIEIILVSVIYINANLLFLYIIKERIK
jgi:hypothetical protein